MRGQALAPRTAALTGTVFVRSATRLVQCPDDAVCEVAFAGRSNAGKSTAINVIVGERGLAKVSRTPGRTQLINFFACAPGRYLVDLPGYGYAAAPEQVRKTWEDMLGDYLLQRPALTALFLIQDSRRPLTDIDWRMIEWFAPTGKRMHILLTKTDKLSRSQSQQALIRTRAALGALAEQCSVQLFSALSLTGVDEARTTLRNYLFVEAT